MKEEIGLLGNEYNLFTTFWTIGYIVGMIPSQIAISRIRASIWIPAAEVVWAILTFSFAAVKNAKQIYALRFLIGLFEAPFYVGAMTLLGNWYTSTELGKRASIFYSASFAANMFSGYLQAAVYKGLNGVHGLTGWRWLFIMCGVITIPGALWGFFAVPDSPHSTKVWYLTETEIELAKSRMVKLDRRPFKGINVGTFKNVLLNPWALIFIVNCSSATLNAFLLLLLNIFSRHLLLHRYHAPSVLRHMGEILEALLRRANQRVSAPTTHHSTTDNTSIPTGAYAIGFVATILFGILSDRLRTRPPIAILITALNIISSAVLAAHPSTAGAFYGFLTNAATYAYGPIVIAWMNEYFSALPDERALILGIAQTMGATFNAWLPLFIFNTGTQAPLFRTGFVVCTVMGGFQVGGVCCMWWISSRGPAMGVRRAEDAGEENAVDVIGIGKS